MEENWHKRTTMAETATPHERRRWLFLARQVRRLEVILADEEAAPKRRPRTRVKANRPKSTKR
jgi:hypothetical protein